MRHIEVTITQTLHVHGMEMDAAVAHAIAALGSKPSQVEIVARTIYDDDAERDV